MFVNGAIIIIEKCISVPISRHGDTNTFLDNSLIKQFDIEIKFI